MFDLGSHLRLPANGFLVGIIQWRAVAGEFVGEVFRFWRNLIEHFFLDNVGAVAIQSGIVAMQQIWQFLTVVDIGGRDRGALCEAGFAVHANMYLHAEVPLVALLGLMHFGITGVVGVLGRAWRCNIGGIHDGAA